jgi:hypothetical protein
METMDQEPTLPIQVGVRPLVFSDASLINDSGIWENQFQINFQEKREWI